MNGKYLITTDNWFYGPDGKQYRGVWGEVQIFDDNQILGIKTNMRSTNWYAKVGTEENHVIIAGCQIHYAIKCEQKPREGSVIDFSIEVGEIKDYRRPYQPYYIAE
jgi:hypothetical protein